MHADTNGTVEFPMKVNAEGPGVGSIFELIDHALVSRRPDSAFAQIGAVAKIVDLFLLLRRRGQPIVDLIHQIQTTSTGHDSSLGRGPHWILLHFPATLRRLAATSARMEKD